MEEKPRYIKCPRCELNYILSNQDYCEVCKQEMKAGYQDEEELNDELMMEEGAICPICKVNYITDEAKGMCDSCYEENSTITDNDDNVDWRSFVNKDTSEDDELDLLPVENDDEIDEELGNTFAKDLDDDFSDNFDDEDDEFNDSVDEDDDFDDEDDIDFDDEDDEIDEEDSDFDDDEDDDDSLSRKK